MEWEAFKVLVITQFNPCHFKLMGYSGIGEFHWIPLNSTEFHSIRIYLERLWEGPSILFGCGRACFRKAYTKSDEVSYRNDKVRRECRNNGKPSYPFYSTSTYDFSMLSSNNLTQHNRTSDFMLQMLFPSNLCLKSCV